MKSRIAALLFPLFRRPALPACVILLLAAASLVILFAAPFRNDISRMLPDGSESMRCYRRLASSAMFNKAPLLFHADDPAVFRTPGDNYRQIAPFRMIMLFYRSKKSIHIYMDDLAFK